MILLSSIKRLIPSQHKVAKTQQKQVWGTCAIFAAVYKQMWSDDRVHSQNM
jgi:hypothetical protein